MYEEVHPFCEVTSHIPELNVIVAMATKLLEKTSSNISKIVSSSRLDRRARVYLCSASQTLSASWA